MSVKQSSRLLIDEPALQVLPSLAVAVGLNEAIVLQQVHYWLKNAEANRRSDNYQDGRWWVYNSYPEWRRDAFPWWSEDTIQRTFKNLEGKGLLITGKLSNNPYDQRKWYSIDYDALDALNLRSSITATCVDASPQNTPMDDSKMRSSHHRKMRSSLTEIETTTETTNRDIAADAAPPQKPANPSKKKATRERMSIQPEAVMVPPAPPVAPEQAAADLAAWDALESASGRELPPPTGTSKDAIERALEMAANPSRDPAISRALKGEIRRAGKEIRDDAICTADDIMTRCVGKGSLYYTTYLAEDGDGGLTNPPTPMTIRKWIWSLETMRSKRWKPFIAVLTDPTEQIRRAIEQNQRITGEPPTTSEPTTRRLSRLSLVQPLSQTA